jgi:hypothetical protein
VDISNYQNSDLPNILFDQGDYFLNNNIIETSSVIYFNENSFDTIIELKAEELLDQFQFIQNNKWLK